MRTFALSLVAGTAVLCGAAVISGQAQAPQAGDVPTFSKDIAPILYANCTGCHRPGEIAPMSLLTYAEARPWAQAISRRVGDGSMPPWHADAPLDTFANERRLTPAQKELIARWAAGGAPQGDPALLPKAPTLAEGWRIGTPDQVFELPEAYSVPSEGTIEYENFYVPTGFTEAKWVQAIEARPGNRTLVHHILVYYQAPPEASAPAAHPAAES